MKVTPLAYRVLLHFKPAFCLRPYFGLASCLSFNNKNNLFSISFDIKKIKNTGLGMHRHTYSCKRYSFVVVA